MAMTTKAFNPIPVRTVKLVSDVAAYTLIGVDGDKCGAAKKAIGVVLSTGEAGEYIGVFGGRVPVLLGGTVAANVQIESDANGKAVTIASGIANGVTEEGGDSGDIVMCQLDVL